MSDTDGRRWYDPNRVAIALTVLVVAFVTWWGSLVWAMARGAETKNVEQDAMLRDIGKSVEKMDVKLERILERLPK